MPLQSGNNKQLRQMRRRYQRELYADRVAHIKKLMPHCCIGVDVIVGFPGETEEDFQETYRFINEMDISYLHVFTYSERPNTPAVTMEGVVPMSERRRRNQMLNILSDKKRRYFYEQHLKEKRVVLFEQSKTEGRMSGFTDNYIRVDLPMEAELLNRLATVSLEMVDEHGLMQAHLQPSFTH
jgi:threonylcarbamoyladenosine tRNA methylthiotransferase MtaB